MHSDPLPAPQLREITDLLSEAMGAEHGFISAMSRKSAAVRQDIAPAFEMYSLLAHYLDKLPASQGRLESREIELKPGLVFDAEGGRLVMALPIPEGELESVALWVAQGIHSATVRQMPGLLVLLFEIRREGESQHLIPEWFCAFYVDGRPDHCVICLALKSVTLLDARFSDWMAIALDRLASFGLPHAAARDALRSEGFLGPHPLTDRSRSS